MECYQVSSAAVPLLMKRAVECEMETLGWERERGGGKKEERQTETHIICPRSKGSHSDIIYRMREGVEV